MPDFFLDFMTPDVWDGLVIGVVLIGTSLAILRLYQDRTLYLRRLRHRHDREQDIHREKETKS